MELLSAERKGRGFFLLVEGSKIGTAAGANDAFDAKTLLDGVARVESVAAVLIGYPHLLPSLRGQALGDAIDLQLNSNDTFSLVIRYFV